MANVAKLLTMSNDRYSEGIFVISDITSKPFKDPTKGHFLMLTLNDRTGQIPAKVWKDAFDIKKILKSAKVFEVQGKINAYKGQNQFVITSVEKAEKFNPSDFLPVSKHNPEIMWEDLVEILNKHITDEDIKELWVRYKNNENFVEKFKVCPGGKGLVHHAYLFGLLEHTFCIIENCQSFCETYKANPSILLMGAFLHDHGKMLSYSYNLSIEMTDIGRLHSHITLGYNSAMNTIDKLKATKEKRDHMKLVLGHLILSHHGTLEHGSPVVPMTLEAILLAKADILDSESNLALIHTDKINEGNWSTYDNLKGKFYFKEN